MLGESAWTVIRGNSYQVLRNSGTVSPADGYVTAVQVTGWGCGTVFRGNRADVRAAGYGIKVDVDGGCSATVYSDNVVLNAGSGVTNIEVTSG